MGIPATAAIMKGRGGGGGGVLSMGWRHTGWFTVAWLSICGDQLQQSSSIALAFLKSKNQMAWHIIELLIE